MRLAVFWLLTVMAYQVYATDYQPKIAIIIDDLGYNISRDRQAIDLPVPVTVAFLPDRNYTKALAKYAHKKGREVMLHLPMESESEFPLGELGLTIAMTDAEKTEKLDQALQAVPFAVGVNNHMGSKMTRDENSMSWLMKALNQRQLFFIDSLTVADSVAWKTAAGNGTPYASRTVFLDNDIDKVSLDKQFQELLTKARKHGSAIAIAHPHPETLNFLRMRLVLARDYDQVQFVPVDQLLVVQ